METKELSNLNRDELFKVLKDKCKSIVKRDLYCWLLCSILVIPLLFSTAQRLLDGPVSIPYYIFGIVIVCLGVWSLLFNVRYLDKVDKIGTPGQLLYWFVKRPRYNLIFWLILCVFISRHSSPSSHGSSFEDYLAVFICFVIIALIVYRGAPWLIRKEKDIIEQLIELVKKK